VISRSTRYTYQDHGFQWDNMGDIFSVVEVSALAGLPPEAALDAIERLAQRRFLAEEALATRRSASTTT
jgi:hypothetical protein